VKATVVILNIPIYSNKSNKHVHVEIYIRYIVKYPDGNRYGNNGDDNVL
jgi:hypothetical protein